MADVPRNALVVSAVVKGRPITAGKRLSGFSIRNIDYFAFRNFPGLDIIQVSFWDEFQNQFFANRDKLEWIYSKLADTESKSTLNRIVSRCLN
uniref:Uncharacterized protein n=1 Tax=Candidatus Kentrum sp. MB TaxID=2138164 RepID=A0A450XWR4_9GAMM|nr:MAG: hypothetical protein BECKMB1821G_GA0114241_10517 [Candidatus Kentron sp. MB]VFK33713.1 MAG: hypothetical protein BECKMB1821I_GA0114274_10527 [Candidatus Kentron sp. MB]VFK76315.1 MAG: hypothetical protein BECKMB1821H_GA0114242_10517 [Candidatus Kentron sp. MB]